MYQRKPERYSRIDAGDISQQLEVKERLKCKSFKYFLEVVAPDMLEKYPPYQTEFASGVIESVAFPNKCIDSLGHFYKEMGLYFCSPNKVHPSGHQHYFLGHNRDIEFYSDSAYCIEPRGDRLELHACHHKQQGQYFRYDLDTQQIKSGVLEHKCLEADETTNKALVKPCNANEVKQKWKWGHENVDNLRNWRKVGARILE